MGKTIFIIFSAIFFFLTEVYCQISSNAGKTSVPWIKMGVSARPAGMADTYTAMGDDASVIYWNPACLAKLEQNSIVAMQGTLFSGMNHQGISVVVPTIDEYDWMTKSAFGIAITMLDMGEIPRTTTFDDALEPTQFIHPSGQMMLLSFSQRISYAITLGVTGKRISEKIETESACYAGDIGFLLSGGDEMSKFSVGFAVQNLGGSMYSDSILPQLIRGGVGLTAGSINLGADVVIPVDHGMKISMGSEFLLGRTVAFRVGYRIGVDEDKLGTSSGFGLPPGISLGVGINTDIVGFDIAWVPYGSLGEAVLMSAILKF